MNIINLAICDDDEHCLGVLQDTISAAQIINNRIRLNSFRSGKDLLRMYAKGYKPFDLIILDIGMPELNGHEVASKIREYDSDVKIAFLSIYDDPANLTKGYHSQAFRYFVKPFSENTINELLRAIASLIETEANSYVTITTKQQIFRIRYRDIVSIVRGGRKNIIKIRNGSELSAYGLFSELIESVKDERFVVINKGILVNVAFIARLDRVSKRAVLIDGTTLPVTSRKMKDLAEKITKNLVEEVNRRECPS